MNFAILSPSVQDFINQNLKTDITALVLRGIPFTEVSAHEVVEQIEAKIKSEKKLPTWFKQSNIYYPNKLNIEQTSSELTANHKSKLISGKTLIDLTGGFGVDAYFFSKQFGQVTHCELNQDLSEIADWNFKKLGQNNIKTVSNDGLFYLQNSSETYDWIYVDPSRRHESKGKVFFLTDCLPNIPENLDELWKYSKNIMIKTSPLLDITVGLKELSYVKTIHVIAVNNEVKELLWILEHGYSGKTDIKTTNLNKKAAEHFDFILENESHVETVYSEPLTYLFEPNSAILKSGGFNSLTVEFNVQKLHKHSHLYTSNTLIQFPGRTFKVEKLIPYNKHRIKNLNIEKANITTRNFPQSVQNLRKSLKIKDGGETYLFFTTDRNHEKIMLICTKVD